MLESIQGFIQSIVNQPIAFVGVLLLLFIVFLIGYMIAWFFKGGVIRFLLGIFLGYGAFMSFMMGDMLMSKIAFAGGFLFRFFNWWQFLIRWQDNVLGMLLRRFEITVLGFLRSFFPNLLQRLNSLKLALKSIKTDKDKQQTENETTNNDDFAQAQAKRAEEIKRERERQKNKGKKNHQQSQSQQGKQSKKHYKKRSRQSSNQSKHKSDRYSSKNRRAQRSKQYQSNQDSQKNKDRINGQKQQQATSPPQQTNDIRTDLEVLGLVQGQTYTADEIKKAYREQSKKAHPDKWQGKPQAIVEAMEQEMIRINQAYENLK